MSLLFVLFVAERFCDSVLLATLGVTNASIVCFLGSTFSALCYDVMICFLHCSVGQLVVAVIHRAGTETTSF